MNAKTDVDLTFGRPSDLIMIQERPRPIATEFTRTGRSNHLP